MEVKITENKLFNSIYNYIDKTFNPSEMDWVYGSNEDDEYGYPDINDENGNFLMFYKGEWEGEYDSDVVFHYFDIDYYNEPSSKSFRDQAPVLEVIGDYGEHLDEMFQGHWGEPMKKWFEDKFNLPVKTVSAYYNYED